MAKIIAPNKSYTGVSASVAFANGKGETDNGHLIKWFKEHGYTVEDEQEEGKGKNPGKEGNQKGGGQKGIIKNIQDAENVQDEKVTE